ncbi:MAG: hypothetical protein FWD84_04125 [Oscillospiraceae bacterium]|nr:hypothetical protein [Oscillospiraceae bacterium]
MNPEIIEQKIPPISAKVANAIALLKADHPAVSLLLDVQLDLEELYVSLWGIEE